MQKSKKVEKFRLTAAGRTRIKAGFQTTVEKTDFGWKVYVDGLLVAEISSTNSAGTICYNVALDGKTGTLKYLEL